AVVAPAHATVVSRRAKLVTPGTFSLVTCWANAGAAVRRAIAIERHARMGELLYARMMLRKAPRAPGRAPGRPCGPGRPGRPWGPGRAGRPGRSGGPGRSGRWRASENF